jgi:hypothetical protein
MQISGTLMRLETMENATDKSVREQCRAAMLRYIEGRACVVDVQSLAPIYHGFYAMRTGTPRWGSISHFLARMEDDGLVMCTYRRDGSVAAVETSSVRIAADAVREAKA